MATANNCVSIRVIPAIINRGKYDWIKKRIIYYFFFSRVKMTLYQIKCKKFWYVKKITHNEYKTRNWIYFSNSSEGGMPFEYPEVIWNSTGRDVDDDVSHIYPAPTPLYLYIPIIKSCVPYPNSNVNSFRFYCWCAPSISHFSIIGWGDRITNFTASARMCLYTK